MSTMTPSPIKPSKHNYYALMYDNLMFFTRMIESAMNEPKFVEFRTSDGLNLPGLLYEATGSKKVVIYLHGNGSSSIFYDEGENRDLPNELNKRGFSLLKFNNRGAHIIKKFNIGEERVPYGMAFEKIKDCVLDIEAAISFLRKLGYKEFYLAGASTGANKICVFNHYRPKNTFNGYIIIAGGDDTGIYFKLLGKRVFFRILKRAKEKIQKKQGSEIIPELLSFDLVFSNKGFWNIANPDGDYNCFPFLETLGKIKLSKKPSLVVYGKLDESAWKDIPKAVKLLKALNPLLEYRIIKEADHRFTGKKKELAESISNWL